MLNKKFEKALSAVTMFATVVCLSGVSMLAPLSASAATIVDGDIIKSNATNSDGTPALSSLDVYIVKIVGTKKFKRLVLNPQVFASYGHLKWSNIKTVSQAEEDSFTTSALVRVDGDTKVFALTPAGDTGAKSWVNVSADQFTSAGSDADSIYTINSVDAGNYTTRTDITSVTQLKAFYKDGTLPGGVVSGDLTVSLSAATPESQNIPTKSSAEFTAINLAAGSSAVTISSITVSAAGIGDSDNVDNVALYVDGSKIGTSKNINENEAVFNFTNPINISANGTKTLTIKATAAASGSYKLGIKEAADIITGGGTVGGSFPIWGNTMSADSNNAIGDVTLTASAGTSSNSFGEDNVLLADFSLQSSNKEATILEGFRLKNGGTNVDGIISNLKLFIDGDEVGSGEYDAATGFATFTIDGNYKIDKGETASVEVYGDLGVANVNNTVALYVKNADDFQFVGDTYGFGLNFATATGITALDTTAEGVVVTLTTGDFTIDMDKAATPAKDVKADTANVALATLKLTSNGENATIDDISNTVGGHDFEIQGTGLEAGELTNVEMRDTKTGAIYDITATFNGGVYQLAMDEDIELVKGETRTFEIRADFDDTIDAGNTAKVYLNKTAMNITGDESNSAISDITPVDVTSATATVKAASLDWTTTALNSKSVVPGSKDVVIYQASLEAGTVDDVKLNSVKLTTHTAQADDFTDNNISAISLYIDGVKVKTLDGDIVEGTGATKGSITFNSLNTVIKAGKTVDFVAKADFAATLTSTAAFGLEIANGTNDIVVRDASNNTAIAENVNNTLTISRTVTASVKGTMKVELLTTDTKADDSTLVLAGTTTASGKYLGELKFTTANEPIKLKELRLENSGTATSQTIAEVQLVDASGTVVAHKTPSANGNVTFTDMNLTLKADQATSYFIAVKTKGMNVEGDASSTAVQGSTIIYNISDTNGVVAEGSDSGLETALTVDTNGTVAVGEWSREAVVSKTATVSGSVLTSIVNALSDGTLQGGQDKIVGKYTLVFDNGSNRTSGNEELKAVLDDLTLTISQSSAFSSDFKIYREDAPGTVVNASAGSTWTNVLANLADGGKVDGSVTLIVTADIATTAADGEYIQTSIATPSTTLTYVVDGSAVANSYLGVTTVNGGTLSE